MNRLFNYVRLDEEETVAEGATDVRDELASATDGATGSVVTGSGATGSSRREQMMSRLSDRRAASSSRASKSASESGTGAADAAEEAAGGVDGATQSAVSEELGEYELEEPWLRPSDNRIQATREMLERVLVMMFSINENAYGYRYSTRYDAAEISNGMVDYVIERRSAPYGNRILLVTELLGIMGSRGELLIPREVFYGPYPQIVEGAEIPLGTGFTLRRDEYGDVVPQYDYLLEDSLMAERTMMLEDLERQYEFARLQDFPGLGRLESNALTRGMAEPVVEVDEYGLEYLPQVPRAIGLRDLFTTFSTGKININTAPAPVIFGLLLSLSEDEANNVALDVEDYRNHLQEEVDPEAGVDRVGAITTPDLGQPRRVRQTEEETTDPYADASSLDPALVQGMAVPFEDLETNYFTELRQLELIDGSDGGPNDLLQGQEGVERVSAEGDTVYRRTIHDLEKVAVFGSTYFEAELKAKPEKGRPGKTGFLTVKRDTTKQRIEVVLWKTQQK